MVENFYKFANGMRGEREDIKEKNSALLTVCQVLGLDLKVKIGWIGLTDQ